MIPHTNYSLNLIEFKLGIDQIVVGRICVHNTQGVTRIFIKYSKVRIT